MPADPQKVVLYTDGVRVTGPLVAGGYRLAFDTWQKEEVARVMMLPDQKNLKLTIEVEDPPPGKKIDFETGEVTDDVVDFGGKT